MVMVPHILIIDHNQSAAQVSQSLVRHILPSANIQIVSPNALAANVYVGATIDMVIIDPADVNEACVKQLQSLQQQQPAMVVVVLTSEPPARHLYQLRTVKVDALLEKGGIPAVLLQRLRHVTHCFGTEVRGK